MSFIDRFALPDLGVGAGYALWGFRAGRLVIAAPPVEVSPPQAGRLLTISCAAGNA